MSGELRSPDGRYWAEDQGDGNFVVYDTISGQPIPVWDRWSYEVATGGVSPLPPPEPSIPPPMPPPTSGVRVIRVTDERDGELRNRGYSDKAQVFIDGTTAVMFVGHASGRPQFFRVDLLSGVVTRLGPLTRYIGEAEGWYFLGGGRLYIPDGAQLHRVNPFDPTDDVVVWDIGGLYTGCRLWQVSSSDDGQAHSATITRRVSQDGADEKIGTIINRNGHVVPFPAILALDESQISRNGRFVLIKEGDDNRIIDMAPLVPTERWVQNVDGALGHSDAGLDYFVGEDDIHGVLVRVNPADPAQRVTLLNTWNLGHISVRGGRCLRAGPELLTLVDLNGGGETIIGPHGMISDGSYDTQVFPNFDPTGRVAAFMSNAAGRMDLYLLVAK